MHRGWIHAENDKPTIKRLKHLEICLVLSSPHVTLLEPVGDAYRIYGHTLLGSFTKRPLEELERIFEDGPLEEITIILARDLEYDLAIQAISKSKVYWIETLSKAQGPSRSSPGLSSMIMADSGQYEHDYR